MRIISSFHFCLLSCFASLIFPLKLCIAVDFINLNQSIREGQTLVSSNERFELGFFIPGNSKNRYLGIRYKKIPAPTYVWVANRDNPVTDATGILKFGEEGNLILLNKAASVLWSSIGSKAGNPIAVAQLLDSGNLVIREEDDEDPENYLWQSFDYPTDTLLSGMKLGLDLRTGLNRFLTSWKTPDDPSTGDYSFKVDRHGFPEVFLWNRNVPIYRSGAWNGIRFSGVPEMKPTNVLSFSFVFNQEEVYYSYFLKKEAVLSRLMVNSTGFLQRYTLLDTIPHWNRFWYAPKDQCDNYKECGPYGICDVNASPVCKCVKGFKPRNQEEWDLRDGSGGCVRKTNWDCEKGFGFLPLKGMKLPDSSHSFVDTSMNLDECKEKCRTNCSCTAYANSDISGGGSGCVIWLSELIDLREYAEDGQDLYVKVAASELEESRSTDSSNGKQTTLIVCITVILGVLLIGMGICVAWKRNKIQRLWKGKTKARVTREKSQDLFDVVIPGTRDYLDENKKDDLELPLFDFVTLAAATNNFSDVNKLGQGGFGRVYKGTLVEGQEVAVKRLSKNSGQGQEEFKNEVILIARLQHRNLVRLLGCSIDMDEKMLIYEYMQNKSLDSIIFDKEKGFLLDWSRRFNIIGGIARGLLYLHQDSRFRIIHRDLKASNILLDSEMNPKISDFGMARIFGGDQTEANTKRIVGTYGYMSPEYAMDGLFSVKSDVFSFGVLVLEIVCGKKNTGFYNWNNQLNLLGHAWRLWREGKGMEIMDAAIGDSFSTLEVLRCIQVGLLCVQELAEDRPTMSSVVLMLSSDSATLPQPKQPGFCLDRTPIQTDSSSSRQVTCTVNQVTVTMLDAR